MYFDAKATANASKGLKTCSVGMCFSQHRHVTNHVIFFKLVDNVFNLHIRYLPFAFFGECKDGTVHTPILEEQANTEYLSSSRINWRVIARTDFCTGYSPIFVYSAKLEVPRMYLAHNDDYRECTNTLIHPLLVRLFSSNVLGNSPRINLCAVPT